MLPIKHLKSESHEDKFNVDAATMNVEDTKLSHINGSSFQLSNMPMKMFSQEPSTITTEKLIYSVQDCNKYVKKENIDDTDKQTKIKEEIFEIDESKDTQNNDFYVAIEKQDDLEIRISSIKSEPVVCNNDRKLYICQFCEHQTANRSCMIEHLQIHCDNDKVYVESEKFQPPIEKFVCDCGYNCSQKSRFITHLKCHSKEKESSHLVKSTLLCHEKKKAKNMFVCKNCDYKTNNKQNFNTHRRRHTGKLPFACNYCDYKCAHLSHLDRHKRTHTGEKPYACTYCDFKFSDKSHLAVHCRRHTGKKLYLCDYCDHKSITKSNFIIHLRKHTGEKPYACNHCDFKTTTKTKLYTHVSKHTGEKPYACNQCDYKSIYKSDLNVHITTIHTGEKPYACNYCDFRTARKQTLIIHNRQQHTDEEIYACDECDFRTRYKSFLRDHKKKHTVVEPLTQVGQCLRTYSRKNVIK